MVGDSISSRRRNLDILLVHRDGDYEDGMLQQENDSCSRVSRRSSGHSIDDDDDDEHHHNHNNDDDDDDADDDHLHDSNYDP
jgi:hypothetical protein